MKSEVGYQEVSLPSVCHVDGTYGCVHSFKHVPHRHILAKMKRDSDVESLHLEELSFHEPLYRNTLSLSFNSTLVKPLIFIEEDPKMHPKDPAIHIMILTHSHELYRISMLHPVIEEKYRQRDVMSSVFSSISTDIFANRHIKASLPKVTKPIRVATAVDENTVVISYADSSISVFYLDPPIKDREITYREVVLKETTLITRWFPFSMLNYSSPVQEDILGLFIAPFPIYEDHYLFALTSSKIKAWSMNRGSFVTAMDIASESSNALVTKMSCIKTDPNSVRIVVKLSSDTTDLHKFIIYNGVATNSGVMIKVVGTVNFSGPHIIDFAISPYKIWAITEREAYYCPMPTGEIIYEKSSWSQVFRKSHNELLNDVNDAQYYVEDVEEFYMEKIFSSGYYTLEMISEVLDVQKFPISKPLLQKEMKQFMSKKGMNWDEFMLFLTGYWEGKSTIIGLHFCTESNMICFIKRGGVSFCREILDVDVLANYFMKPNDEVLVSPLYVLSKSITQDEGTVDLVHLFNCLAIIDSQIPAYLKESFANTIKFNNPIEAAGPTINYLLGDSDSSIYPETLRRFRKRFVESFNEVRSPIPTISYLVQLLGLSNNPPEHIKELQLPDIRGDIYSEIICQSLSQMVQSRYATTRSLLLLLLLLEKIPCATNIRSASNNVDPFQGDQSFSNLTNLIKNNLLRVSELLTNILALKWLTTSYLEATGPNVFIIPSILEAYYSHLLKEQPKANVLLTSSNFMCHPVIQYIFENSDNLKHNTWNILQPLVESLAFYLLNNHQSYHDPVLSLPNFLLKTSNYYLLKEYIRIIKPNNSAYLWHLLGECHMHFSEYHKATSCFTKASFFFIKTNDLALNCYINENKEISDENIPAPTKYQLLLLSIWEKYSLSEYLVQAAHNILHILSPPKSILNSSTKLTPSENHHLVTELWSTIFYHSLRSGDFDEAYLALTEIMKFTTPSKRSTSMTQFLESLCEKGEIWKLVSFPFRGESEMVVDILLDKARNREIGSGVDYYNILYSYFISRKDLESAASVLYEKAIRIPIENLQGRINTLLAAINSLEVSSQKWIRKSLPLEQQEGFKNPEPIVQIQDLRKELVLLKAFTKLGKNATILKNENILQSAKEAFPLLLQNAYYDSAVELCRSFELDLLPVFEILVDRWLFHNYSGGPFKGQYQSVDKFPPPFGSTPSSVAWTVISHYLKLLETPATNFRYHGCVADKILYSGSPLPKDLKRSFRTGTYSSVLLNLYLKYGQLKDAVDLTVEILQRATEDALQLDTSVHVPFNRIEELLQRLGEEDQDIVEEIQKRRKYLLLASSKRMEVALNLDENVRNDGPTRSAAQQMLTEISKIADGITLEKLEEIFTSSLESQEEEEEQEQEQEEEAEAEVEENSQ
eukprot:TRINITY_DN14186_c0_g1_i1.p1 TRINITY_DN14186_c0_g1~~TRINITY_DN14186_c0_g1_i1.p1  ORF type:complete len:1393 (+),score=358.22 TRINITY_DN14186_c0_g1_i1:3-4181(+)